MTACFQIVIVGREDAEISGVLAIQHENRIIDFEFSNWRIHESRMQLLRNDWERDFFSAKLLFAVCHAFRVRCIYTDGWSRYHFFRWFLTIFYELIAVFVRAEHPHSLQCRKCDFYLASRWAYFFITSQRAFNPSKRLYVNYDGYVVSVEDMNALGHAYDENEMMFKVQEKLQKLDLNEEENSILAALCVMSAG